MRSDTTRMPSGLDQGGTYDFAAGKKPSIGESFTVLDLDFGQNWQIRHAPRVSRGKRKHERQDR
jgi:hypothetical protein